MTAHAWYAISLALALPATVLVWVCVIQHISERLRLRAAKRRVTAAYRRMFQPGADPTIPNLRLYDAGGWANIGGRKVHRSCNEARRDGRHVAVCGVCKDRLGMAPTGGAG